MTDHDSAEQLDFNRETDMTEHARERKRAEEALHVQSGIAAELLVAVDAATILEILARRVYALAEGAIVATTEYEPSSRAVIVRSIRWTEAERQRASAILGREFDGMVLAFQERVRERWRAGELAIVPGGLADLFSGQLPAPVTGRLTRALNVGDIFVMACVHEEDFLGGVAIIRRARGPLTHAALIESLVTQAALALKRNRAEKARREAEERLRIAQDLSLDAFTIIEAVRDASGAIVDFRWTYVNPVAGRILRHAPADLVGRRLLEVLPGNKENSELFTRYVRVVTTGEPHDFELRYESDGICGWFRNMAVKVGDGVAISFSDITERKRTEERVKEALAAAEKRAAEVDAIIQAIPHAVVFGDEQGARWCNAEALRLLGAADLDELQRRMRELSSTNTRRRHLDGRTVRAEELPFKRALAGEVASLDTWFEPGNTGKEVLIRSHAAPVVVAGKTNGAVVIDIDITDQQHMQEELRDADHRKNEFLAVLSHELRNPLAPIKNALCILKAAEPGSELARRAQAIIERQAGQLTRLVDDLLDITRITRNKIQLRCQRLELNELVGRTLEDYRPLFEESGVVLELEASPAPVFVWADGNRLAQVIGNLLQNAVKFTAGGGRTKVSVSAKDDMQRAVICVTDTGVGVTPEMLTRLFQPFMQADTSLDRSLGGLGLGLALVRRLVEMHGGVVTAHSDGPGRGTVCIVRLPLDASRPALADEPAVRAAAKPRRILLIEDNLDAGQSLRDALALGGHDVAVCRTGPEGLATARQMKPDVILCDIGLPGMDGFEVARAARADGALAATTLVAVSGYALPDDVERARRAGFAQHLAKPLDFEKLMQLLEALPLPAASR